MVGNKTIKVTQLEVVKLLNNDHHHGTSSSAWATIDGCQHAFVLSNEAEVEVIAHAHVNAYDHSRRADLGYENTKNTKEQYNNSKINSHTAFFWMAYNKE